MRRYSIPLFELATVTTLVVGAWLLVSLASDSSWLVRCYDQIEHRITLYKAYRITDAEMEALVRQRTADLEKTNRR